jgi:hypothetical protein
MELDIPGYDGVAYLMSVYHRYVLLLRTSREVSIVIDILIIDGYTVS